jgi:hypothetical protein
MQNNSLKFVSWRPENNSFLEIRKRFYFNEENPWDKVKKSTKQNSAKKSAKGNRLTSSQRGLTSTCVIFPNRVQCFSYKTPGYALKFFLSQFREVGKISFCKPNLERLFLEKSLEVNEYHAGYYTATLHLIFIQLAFLLLLSPKDSSSCPVWEGAHLHHSKYCNHAKRRYASGV